MKIAICMLKPGQIRISLFLYISIAISDTIARHINFMGLSMCIYFGLDTYFDVRWYMQEYVWGIKEA